MRAPLPNHYSQCENGDNQNYLYKYWFHHSITTYINTGDQ